MNDFQQKSRELERVDKAFNPRFRFHISRLSSLYYSFAWGKIIKCWRRKISQSENVLNTNMWAINHVFRVSVCYIILLLSFCRRIQKFRNILMIFIESTTSKKKKMEKRRKQMKWEYLSELFSVLPRLYFTKYFSFLFSDCCYLKSKQMWSYSEGWIHENHECKHIKCMHVGALGVP